MTVSVVAVADQGVVEEQAIEPLDLPVVVLDHIRSNLVNSKQIKPI